MRSLILTALLGAMSTLAFGAPRALATAQFQAVFLKEYINDHKDKDFAKMVKTKARCHSCHRGKKVVKDHCFHNEFGKHLIALLDPKKDAKDVDKIKAALEKVVNMRSDPKDENSPTYGELLEQGKLPGGDLETAKKDLTDEEIKVEEEFKTKANKEEAAAAAK
jgi:hypothetical protein